MEKNHILYIGNLNLPDKNAAALRTVSNSKVFRDLGYRVYLLGVTTDIDNEENIWKEIEPDIFILNYRGGQSLHNIMNNIKFVKSQINDLSISVIITYNLISPIFYYLLKYSKQKKILILSDVTEWYSIRGYKFPFNLLKGLDVCLRMRILHKKVDGLIVISEFLETYYRNKEVVLLPPLIDINDRTWSKLAQELSKISKNDAPVFSYVGNIGKSKDDILTIIRSFLRIEKPYKLNVVGLNYHDLFNIDKNIYEKCSTYLDKITFYGKVSHLEALKVLVHSDFSLIIRDNSRMNNAGFPTKFVESVTCHTPVVSTNISDVITYKNMNVEVTIVSKDTLSYDLENIINKYYDSINDSCKMSSLSDIFHYNLYSDRVAGFLQSIYKSR